MKASFRCSISARFRSSSPLRSSSDRRKETSLLSCSTRAESATGAGSLFAVSVSGLVGPSETIPLIDGELGLSTWQNVFLCEFDGPRSRSVYVTVLA